MPEGMLLPPPAAQPAKVAAAPAPDSAASAVSEPEGEETFQRVLQAELAKPENGTEAGAGEGPAEPQWVTAPAPDAASLLGLAGALDGTAGFVALRRAARAEPEESLAGRVLATIMPQVADAAAAPVSAETARRPISFEDPGASRTAGLPLDDPAAFVPMPETADQDAGARLSPARGATDLATMKPAAVHAPGPDAGLAVGAASMQIRAIEPSKPAIPVAVGAPGWGDALADRVTVMVQGRQPSAELQLNPPNLGPVEIRVSVSGEQATVSFHSPHAPVREAIQASMPRLAEAFAEAGLGLGSVFVGTDARSGDQRAPQQQGRGPRNPGEAGLLDDRRGAGEVAWNGPLSGLRAVDLFA